MKSAIGEIKLPYPTLSGNEIRRMHPHAYKRLRDNLAVFLRIEGKPIPRCEPGEFRTVTLERRGPRALDYDNLVAGAKPLIDAIRIVGLIEDDRPECVDLKYHQTVGAMPKDRGTKITIERSQAFKCEAGHTTAAFGCLFCILKARGLEGWLCGCGDEHLPESTHCARCRRQRPARFDNERAIISEASIARRKAAVG